MSGGYLGHSSATVSVLRDAHKGVRYAHCRPSILQCRLPFTLLEVAAGQELGKFSHLRLRDRGSVLIAGFRLDILCKLCSKDAEMVQGLLLSAASPHEFELGIDNIWWGLGISMIVRISSLHTHSDQRPRKQKCIHPFRTQQRGEGLLCQRHAIRFAA